MSRKTLRLLLPTLLVSLLFSAGLADARPLPRQGATADAASSDLAAEADFDLYRQLARELRAKLDSQPANLDLRYELGAVLNEMAVMGDEEALEEALRHFRYIYRENPERHDARAFYGSMQVLKAKYVSLFSKLKWAERGFQTLDNAVSNAPDTPAVRLIRFANSSQVPSFLNRDEVARQDLDWLLANLEAHPAGYTPEFRRIFFFFAGEWMLKQDDATCLKYLKKAASLPGSPHLGPRIERTLEKARQTFPNAYALSQ